MKICVYGAASSLIDNHYIEAGIELGKELAKRGHGLVFGGSFAGADTFGTHPAECGTISGNGRERHGGGIYLVDGSE